MWWNLIIGVTVNKSAFYQFLQCGGQDSIGNVVHFLSYFTVAQNFLFCQNTANAGFPFSSEQTESVFQGTAYIFFQFPFISCHRKITSARNYSGKVIVLKVTLKFISEATVLSYPVSRG